jgi:hypothetical protein
MKETDLQAAISEMRSLGFQINELVLVVAESDYKSAQRILGQPAAATLPPEEVASFRIVLVRASYLRRGFLLLPQHTTTASQTVEH